MAVGEKPDAIPIKFWTKTCVAPVDSKARPIGIMAPTSTTTGQSTVSYISRGVTNVQQDHDDGRRDQGDGQGNNPKRGTPNRKGKYHSRKPRHISLQELELSLCQWQTSQPK